MNTLFRLPITRFSWVSFFAILLVLAYRAYQDIGTDDTDEMRLAEPEGDRLPPLGY